MKTTEQNNRLIAEFMDVPTESTIINFAQPDGYTRAKTVTAYQIESKRTDEFSNLTFDFQLKYHTSWDWLMPVVFKICEMKDAEAHRRHIVCMSIRKDISFTYNAVVEFIEWYNENK